MNTNHHTPGSDDSMTRLLDQVGRADAGMAESRGSDPMGATLEDRVFASTRRIVSAQTPVIARIGPRVRVASALRLAAAVALVGMLGIGYAIATRSGGSASPTTNPAPIVAKADAGADVEIMLAAVSLLDEPLAGGLDDLAADARRLHELVTSDRVFGVEQPEEPTSRQGA